MKNRNADVLFVFVSISSLFITPIEANGQRNETSDSVPNIILILADDMGMGDLAVFNGGLNRTPNLDQLVNESIWFDQAYSASAVCAPARASLLTGRYPHRTGVVGLSMRDYPTQTSLSRGESTIADIFEDNGYHTGLVGKWHLGSRPEYHPMKRGFMEFSGFMEALTVKSYYKYELDINGAYKKYNGQYLTDVLTEYAIEFVNRNKAKPFFLHLAHYAPHRPLEAPGDLVGDYEQKGYDPQTAKIYAMIEVMDKGIGMLLDELDRLGIRENTIVIFLSDNGPDPLTGERFNQQLRGRKYDVFEGGIHVPMLVNWKGTLAAGSVEQMIHFADILPTIADLCQLKVDKSIIDHIDGVSFANLLFGESNSFISKTRYWQWNRGVPYYNHNAAIRDGDWKLVYPPVTSGMVFKNSDLKPFLFNIKYDPLESTDVSSQNPDTYNRMKALLEDWSRKMEADRLRATSFDN